MELNGTSAVISGGASGLGEATARVLAAAGATVVIADLNENRGKQVADEIRGLFARTDVTDEASVQAAVDLAVATGEPLRTAVSCAGIGWASRTVGRDGTPHDLASYQRVIAVNLVGTFNVMRIAAAAMAKTEPADADGQRGVVVNTSSVAGIEGQTGQIAYSASKGGIIGMTVPAARDLAVIGVRVNTICPGIIDTPIYGFSENSEEFKARMAAPVVFPKRIGRPDEFGHLVRSLIENDYMNAVQREDRLAGGHDRLVGRIARVVAGLERHELGGCPVGHPLRCGQASPLRNVLTPQRGCLRLRVDRLACSFGEQVGPGPRHHIGQVIPSAAGEQPAVVGRLVGERVDRGVSGALRVDAQLQVSQRIAPVRVGPVLADQHLRPELPQQRRDDRVKGAQPAGITGPGGQRDVDR